MLEGASERLLERIFGPKMKESLGSWKRVKNEELHIM
jgi:hypothetical protein